MWPSLMARRTKRQAPRLLLARPRRRRQHGDQRPDRHPRRARRLRPLGRARLRGLVRPACPAVLQPARGRPRLRRPRPITAGAARSRSSARRWSAGAGRPGPARRGARPRLSLGRRPQRARRRRRLHLRHQQPRRRARLDQRRLSRACARPPQPRDPGRRPWSTGCCSTAAAPSASARRVAATAGLPRRRTGRARGRRFHSPPILMRSGIGRGRASASHGIEVVEDLPVGDHRVRPSLCPHGAQAEGPSCALDRHRGPPQQLLAVKYSSGLAGGGDDDMPMMAFNHGGIGGDLDPSMFGEAGIHCSLFEASLARPVRLASARPAARPARRAQHAGRRARPDPPARRRQAPGRHRDPPGGAGASPARSRSATPARPVAELDRRSRPGLRRLAPRRLTPKPPARCRRLLHGPVEVGTAAARRPRRPRPRGIDGLRVADASIMPYDCKANTSLTAIMIGEHVADRMWRKPASRSPWPRFFRHPATRSRDPRTRPALPRGPRRPAAG